MRKKIILSLGIIAAVAVIILLSVKITAHFVEREYRVEPWSHQKNLEITKFSVKKEDVKLSIFRNSFDVYIYIKGTIDYDGMKPYISYIHKSERYETIDGERVVVIELTPVVETKMFSLNYNYHVDFDKKLTYRLRTYTYGYNKYIFRCGDFEKTVYMNQEK